MTVDALTFLGDSLFGARVDAAGLLAALDGAGIERAVACPLKPRGYHLAPANDAVAEAARAHPDRLWGIGRVDPLQGPEAVEELERCLSQLGLRGVLLHPWEETFTINDPRVFEVVEVAAARGVPVVVAAGYPWLSEALQVADLVRRFPRVRFVATNGLQINMSGLGQTDAEIALRENDNLSILTTGVYREDFIQRIVERHGAGRVLFASAYPHFDPRLELKRVEWAGFDDAEQAAMLAGGASELFGRETN